MVTLPALFLRWTLVYTLLKFQGDPARESVWPKQWLFEAIFRLMLWHYRRKIFWVFWKIYRWAMVTQWHPPSPTKETACEPAWQKPWKCAAIFWLCCNPGTLRLATNCELRAYGHPVWRTVTICHRIPVKNTIYKHICSNANVFHQYYPEVFCNHRWKIQLKRSSIKVMLLFIH